MSYSLLVDAAIKPPMKKDETMTTYTFYIEGLNRDASATASTERAAWQSIWNTLTDEERDAVVSHECVDEQEARP